MAQRHKKDMGKQPFIQQNKEFLVNDAELETVSTTGCLKYGSNQIGQCLGPCKLFLCIID